MDTDRRDEAVMDGGDENSSFLKLTSSHVCCLGYGAMTWLGTCYMLQAQM